MANTIRGKATVSQNTRSQVIGITAPVPMGEWQSTTPYLKLNIVRYNGASYIAKKQSTGVEPTVTTGWQEVWQSVAYDGLVTPVGNYPDMTVGKATQAENDGAGKNISDQFSAIDEVIPSTASENNQLADKAFVNSSINAMAAFYITYNADGDAFPTRADLLSATTFYCGGEARVPTQNDYALVMADESQAAGVDGSYPTTRYSYQGGTYPNGQWDFQYIVNNTSLTQAQVDAINSGITKELVETIGKGNVLSVNGETGAVTITPESIGAVNKSGDTMTGNLDIVRGTSGDTGVRATRTDTDNEIFVGIGTSGENRGIFDKRLNKWIVRANNTNVYVNEQIPLSYLGNSGNGYTNNSSFNHTYLSQAYDTQNVENAPTSNGYWIIGAQSSANYGSQFACSDNGNAYYRRLSANKWYDWEEFLKLDPTKLSPTTANGWTVGTSTLTLPSEGVYLVSINGNSPSILVWDNKYTSGSHFASCTGWDGLDGEFGAVNYDKNGRWYQSGNTITSVAYKKIL